MRGLTAGRGVAILAVACVVTMAAAVVDGMQQAAQRSADSVWEFTDQRPQGAVARDTISGPFVVVRFNKDAFDGRMALAGRASDPASSAVMLTLPMPDGTFHRFLVKESPILVPHLAAAFPTFKTYAGQGIDDPTATIRFGWTDAGFHSILLSSQSGTVYIDPYTPTPTEFYVVYRKSDLQNPGDARVCLLQGDHADGLHGLERLENVFPISHGGEGLRTYQLALAATVEYTTAAGNTKALALSRMMTTMDRVNGIYERDLSVRMTLSTGPESDPTALIHLAADGDDGYTNEDGDTMLDENQVKLDAVIGTANYDIGHVFSTGGGGIAVLRSSCNSLVKAGGVTGSSNPTGDGFDVDFVAHEIGHQFGGNHTFNGTAGNCEGDNRSANHAYEVGSGVTIQAYAGICSVENLQRNSIDRFHVESLDEMTAFLTTGGGSTCGTTTPTGNTPPTVEAGASYTIPARTPFVLTASGSDADGDTLTYAWEQFDRGTASSNVATATTDDGTRPLFRPYQSSTSPVQYFPSLQYILNNANAPPLTYSCSGPSCLTGETLPTTSRTLNFQVTARDNRSGGGAIATDGTTVTTVATAGPFVVTSQSSSVSVTGNSSMTVTWNVVGTTAAPISAANVAIAVSLDGGATFSTVLASTPNDGTHAITVPNVATTQGRVRVMAVGNIFFDINDANFTISASDGALTATPSALRFAATKDGADGPLVAVTGTQIVTVSFLGTPTPQWTATSNQAWAVVTNGTGIGTGTFSVSIANPGNVIGNSTSLTASITLSAPNAGTTTTIPVELTVYQPTSVTTPPIGRVDSPAQNASGVQGALAMTGWAVDDIGIQRVRIYRQCLQFDNPQACLTVLGVSVVFVGDASIIAGARPDVEATFPSLPASNAAGWGFLILSNTLPHIPNATSTGGVGTFQLYAVARDYEGHEKLLGRLVNTSEPTTVTATNDTIAKPFGTIDTPGQGATVSGLLHNFGWVLTPDPGTSVLVPIDGSTIAVYIDGAAIGTAQYDLCRGTVGNPVPVGTLCDDDVSTRFRGDGTRFRNLDVERGPIGLRSIDTTTLSNARHTISWGVRDSAGRVEGIGSRFFTVLNSGADAPAEPRDSGTRLRQGYGGQAPEPWAPGTPIWARTGYDVQAAYTPLEPNAEGVPQVRIPEHGRVELQIPGAVGGALIANGTVRALPVGVGIDRARGVVTWVAGPGYFGTYRLRFEVPESRGPEVLGAPAALNFVWVDITVASASTVAGNVRMRVDRADVHGATFTLHGWALDPQAATGAGIGTVHVWGRRRSPEVPGSRGPEVPKFRSSLAQPNSACLALT